MADVADDYSAVERGMQLADLCWHWGDAYEINWAGEFRAVRRDNGLVLEAASADELRALIRCDYACRPVPRRPQSSRADRQRRRVRLVPYPPA
jgi:hypothetical protein